MHFFKSLFKWNVSVYTAHLLCPICALDYLKASLDSKSRLPISEFKIFYGSYMVFIIC